ncbi:MAG TPA: glycerol-3-phosphate acyltransferase [Firmicutes bacterium]|nr:glycerol-3-phosphate acyltransferase [Bacillota bacterium]
MFFLMLKAYLVGSVPFAYIFAWLAKKFDIRKIGSQNVGTTNVIKEAGWLPGILTALADGSKGLFAVLIGSTTGNGWELPALLMAIVGHNWPVWLGFHGGGGLATFIGGMLFAGKWWVVPVLLGLWGAAFLLIREYNRSVLVACSLSPFLLGWVHASWRFFFFGLGAGLALGSKCIVNLCRAAKAPV